LHQLSAAADPVAPITFHETNPAHSAAGVLTAGVEARRWQVEASAFNATQADPARVLPADYALNSAAARASWNPGPSWTLELSGGRIAAAPGHHAGAARALRSYTASASYHRLRVDGGGWATTATLARLSDAGRARDVALVETSLSLGAAATVFGRMEAARRGLEQITILEQPDGSHVHLVSSTPYSVGALSGGLLLDRRVRGARLGLGGRASLSLLSPLIAPDYGRRRALGFGVFLSARPAAGGGMAEGH
jgi:hypothetical protein